MKEIKIVTGNRIFCVALPVAPNHFNTMKNKRILIVEDDAAAVFGYTRYLSRYDFIITAAESLAKANEALLAQEFDGAILDISLPDGSSLDIISTVRTSYPSMAVLIISGTSDIPTAVKALHGGADDFLTKPVNMEALVATLEKCLELASLRRKEGVRKRLIKTDDSFFGESRAMVPVREAASVAAESDAVTLITGETGTGKGVLAHWIHNAGSRATEPFVELNCSALRGDLLRSELFGHAKGSFTSAIRDQDGLIEVAHGGTLFLDEIGDMDKEVQAQLLKTLEERTFRRIGESRLRQSNFRLIAATNKDLKTAVADGSFRSDLFYRIAIFPIHLPSLSSRQDDIPGLIAFLLKKINPSSSMPSVDVIDALVTYTWPGNIRELKNVLERAMLFAHGGPLSLHHFSGVLEPSDAPLSTPVVQGSPPPSSWDLNSIELTHIAAALEHFKGDRKAASEALGISLASLYRKIPTR